MSRKFSQMNQTSYRFVFNYMLKYDQPFSIIEITQQIYDEYVFCDFEKLKRVVIDTIQELFDKGILHILSDDKYELDF